MSERRKIATEIMAAIVANQFQSMSDGQKTLWNPHAGFVAEVSVIYAEALLARLNAPTPQAEEPQPATPVAGEKLVIE